jgi:hypothetical protein
MDSDLINVYLVEWLARERGNEVRARAAREALAHALRLAQQPLRVHLSSGVRKIGRLLLAQVQVRGAARRNRVRFEIGINPCIGLGHRYLASARRTPNTNARQ